MQVKRIFNPTEKGKKFWIFSGRFLICSLFNNQSYLEHETLSDKLHILIKLIIFKNLDENERFKKIV